MLIDTMLLDNLGTSFLNLLKDNSLILGSKLFQNLTQCTIYMLAGVQYSQGEPIAS